MRAVCPEGRLGWLVPTLDRAVCERAGDLELFQLCPRADAIAPGAVAVARSIAAEVRVWGLSGTPQEVRALVRRAQAPASTIEPGGSPCEAWNSVVC